VNKPGSSASQTFVHFS